MSTLFQNILTASFHGSIVILAVLLLRLALKKTPRKFFCLLWLLAGLRLLMPFQIQSPWSLQPQALPMEQVETLLPMASPALMAMEEHPAVMAFPSVTQPPVEREALSPAPAVPEQTPAASQRALDPMDLLPWLWLGVASCFLIYTLACYCQIKKTVREAVLLRDIPGCWECDRIETAFILGFLRPQVYIPMGLSPSVRRHILAHERTHLEKGDHWIKMLGFLALALHWFNPLVWVAYTLLCKDMEMACDERVIRFMSLQERKEYSAALLNCSTHRSHYAACPVAFGEVSVKERIFSVLKYKKPGFWVSLAGLAAVIFVAMCLVTSPVEPEKAEGPEFYAESPVNPEDTGFAHTLETDTDIKAAIQAGLEAVIQRDSYQVTVNRQVYLAQDQWEAYVTDNYKSGENFLSLLQGEEPNNGITNSYMVLEGQWYHRDGQTWVLSSDEWSNSDFDPDGWLREYLPSEMILTFPEGAGIQDGSTVTYRGQWEEKAFPYEVQLAEFTLTFHPDGTLDTLTRQQEGILLQLTFHRESPQDLAVLMEGYAQSAITADQVALQRIRDQQVTEVPSNKTDFDKDYSLGAGQMGWNFLDGEWFFKFGAEDIQPTGLTLVPEYNGAYGTQSVPSGSIQSGGDYFLEKLVGQIWTTVPPVSDSFQPLEPKTFRQMAYPNITSADHQHIRWEANYGSLEPGFYRIGNRYTFTGANGQTDTQVCYAKFRLYDPNQDALLAQARKAMEQFLHQHSYQLTATHPAFCSDTFAPQEILRKSGDNYLMVMEDTFLSPGQTQTTCDGALYRDGVYYGLEWKPGEAPLGALTDLWVSEAGYMDTSNFTMWANYFQWFDAQVELVYQEGRQIHILERISPGDQWAYEETVITLDGQGNLLELKNSRLPSLPCTEQEKQVNHVVTVIPEEETAIAQTIESIDVTQPLSFDYAADLKALEAGTYTSPTLEDTQSPLTFTLETQDFRNTEPSSIRFSRNALDLAREESRLATLMTFQQGFLQSRTYRDSKAGMWKVELYWWQNDDCYQAVYLDDQGVTQGIVTCHLA